MPLWQLWQVCLAHCGKHATNPGLNFQTMTTRTVTLTFCCFLNLASVSTCEEYQVIPSPNLNATWVSQHQPQSPCPSWGICGPLCNKPILYHCTATLLQTCKGHFWKFHVGHHHEQQSHCLQISLRTRGSSFDGEQRSFKVQQSAVSK